MTSPKVTIGMAHFADPLGVYATIQDIHLAYAGEDCLKNVEMIVVDNSPHLPGVKDILGLVDKVNTGKNFHSVKYYVHEGPPSTAQPRNAVFDFANAPFVVCVDCHVKFPPGTIPRLLKFAETHKNSNSLFQGPMLQDPLIPNVSFNTHFNDQWRGLMWGTWGNAWQCKCGKFKFSVIETPAPEGEQSRAFYVELVSQKLIDEGCNHCGHSPHPTYFNGHERVLLKTGFTRVGGQINQPPFEIPAMGLGMFACNKRHWLRFNENFLGFGGEEFYIHCKYRQAGAACYCVPALPWLHRFMRPGGAPYVPTNWNKMRNYVLGLQELGLDHIIDTMFDHFKENVDDLKDKHIEYLMKDPLNNKEGLHSVHSPGCQDCQKEIAELSLDEVYEYYKQKPSDFNEHYDKIRETIEVVGPTAHVTEFGKRDYGIIPLAMAKPQTIRSYNRSQKGAAFWKIETLIRDDQEIDIDLSIQHINHLEVEIEETDVLFIDTEHHADQLRAELLKHGHKVRRFIILHDTELYGLNGVDNKPGLKVALREWLRINPHWSVVYETKIQAGLMVLSCNSDDKPKRPGPIKLATTFAKHYAMHVADGLKNVTREHLEERLSECTVCSLRTHNAECGMCGCPIAEKPAWRSSRCEANRWVDIDKKYEDEYSK